MSKKIHNPLNNTVKISQNPGGEIKNGQVPAMHSPPPPPPKNKGNKS